MKARRDAISSEIGAFKRKKAKTESDFTKHQNNLEVQDILNRYLQTIANVSDVSLYVKKGSGSENINNQKETHIRFLVQLMAIFLWMFPN